MKLRTFFCENKIGERFFVSDDEAKHMAVLRVRCGEHVLIINNTPEIFECEVESIDKKSAVVRIVNVSQCDANPKNNLTAFVCLLKQDKNEFVTEKLTELGICKIVFVDSKFVSREGKLNMLRLQKIAISACKQCGRSLVPKIETCNINEIKLNEFDEFVVAYENEQKQDFKLNTQSKNVAFLVGSEGGFDESEIKFLASSGAKIFGLGKRILRAETATLVVATLCQNVLKEI